MKKNVKTRLSFSFVLLTIMIILANCKKEEKTSIPLISTVSIKNTTKTSTNCESNITSDGGASITIRGVCWSTGNSPTISDSKTSDGTGTGTYTSSITNLIPGETYYVKSYATNSVGTGYGTVLSFTTQPITIPVLTLTAVTNITQTTANSGGNISNDGGATVSKRGVCWSTGTNPTISDSKTENGSGIGSFTSDVVGLNPGSTYYIKSYATNSVGTGYSDAISFITLPIEKPSLNTTIVTSISQLDAISGGTNLIDGGTPITAKGICWGTSQNPTIADNHTADGTGTGNFSSNMISLVANTIYHVRAYATNSIGTGYGQDVQFTTLSFYVGQIYGGGVIFYVDASGRHGLITATTDQGTLVSWFKGSLVTTGATAREIGSGATNTQKIVSVLGTGNYAANLCDQFVSGVYDDWFLPSLDELGRLWNLTGTGSLSTTKDYWGSTQISGSNEVWYVGSWTMGTGNEYYKASVRAVRSF